jgi:hypothetical protein
VYGGVPPEAFASSSTVVPWSIVGAEGEIGPAFSATAGTAAGPPPAAAAPPAQADASGLRAAAAVRETRMIAQTWAFGRVPGELGCVIAWREFNPLSAK